MAEVSEGDDDIRFITNSVSEWQCRLAPDGRVARVSPSVTRVTGYSVEECLAQADYPFPLFDPRDHAELRRVMDAALSGGEGEVSRLRLLRKDGSLAWVDVAWQGRRDASGAPDGASLTVHDIHGGKLYDLQMRYQDALSSISRGGLLTHGDCQAAFRAIAETSARALNVARVGVWLLSPDRQAIHAETLFRYPDATFESGPNVARADYPRYFQALDEDRVIAAADAWHDPRTAELLEGYLDPMGIRAMLDAPIVRGGRTVGVICHEHLGGRRYWTPAEIGFSASMADFAATALDAAERRDLDNLRRRLAAIIEATPDFVGTADADGSPVYINPAGRDLVGLGRDEPLEGWSIADLYGDRTRRLRDEVAIPSALRDGVWSGETEFRTRTGDSFPVSQVIIVHKDAAGRPTATSTVARDMRPWKAIEADLRERERFLSTLVSNLPGVAYRRRNAPGWPMEYISQGCLELTGYTPASFLSGEVSYNDIVHPDDHARVQAEVESALAEGRAFHAEYRIRRADGREVWVWSKGRGIQDASGALIAREGFIGDITERVHAQHELERLNAELEARVAERTARLREANQNLESFAYSVSHDLKAPLRGIDGYSRLLVEDYAEALPEEARRFLGNIRAASERMNQLIDDLLAYSRLERRELNAGRQSLAAIVERVLAEREIERTETAAEVTVEVGDLDVIADGDALVQVIRNLFDNALKFAAAARPPRIHLAARNADDTVLLSVADNGCGFDMKYHERIFEIFQRLHRDEDYPGTGVGLAIVRKAIERMGGRVWARSAPGEGATFYLELKR